MFPNAYEFTWDPYRLVFVTFFLCAAMILIGYLGASALRTWRDVRSGRAGELRWHDDFAELPTARRRCRTSLSEGDGGRICTSGFDCAHCVHHDAREVSPLTEDVHVHGLTVHPDRAYHRGHTWVRDEADGVVKIGLSPLALRVLPAGSAVRPAAAGELLHRGDAAFELARESLRILTPVDGQVIESGQDAGGPWLRLAVQRPLAAHAELLRGQEAVRWMEAELRQLQAGLLGPDAAQAWADGGAVVDDLPLALPALDWRSVRQEFFLDV